MDYRTLAEKPVWKYGPEKMTDLHAQTFTGAHVMSYVIEVTRDYIARPDLVSFAAYNTDVYADAICKYNGISNPNELNEGMLIFIPFISELPLLYEPNPAPSKYADDGDQVAFKEKTNKKKKNERRSPRDLVEGQENYFVDENLGLIFY